MSEHQDSVADEISKKIFLRSHNTWKAGEKLLVSYVPMVEGMVVATRWVESVFMVVFLSPPYKKPEGTVAEAALMYKSAASLVKKPLPSYDYPFPSDPRILEEILKANGNVEMLNELVRFMTQQSPFLMQGSTKSPQVTQQNLETEDFDKAHLDKVHSDRLSVQLLLSQPDVTENQPISNKLLDQVAEQVSRRLSVNTTPPPPPPIPTKKEKKSRKKKATHSSSSSSASSESEESSSSQDENVRCLDSEEADGWFKCPFSLEEYRRKTDPQKRMKGKVEERRYVRKALHNIYTEFSTLKGFVDTIRAESVSSPSKTYNSDLIWLAYYATYLDLLLLHAIEGPWRTWNELVVDQLGKSFLELVVRSSTNRVYPEILDERVRKWMKRKRIGLSAQYGAIPSFLVSAKITDSGVHPKGGWESRTVAETKSSPTTTSYFKPKAQQNRNASTDKKT